MNNKKNVFSKEPLKDRLIHVRMTNHDALVILKKATHYGVSASKWIREAALRWKPTKKDLGQP